MAVTPDVVAEQALTRGDRISLGHAATVQPARFAVTRIRATMPVMNVRMAVAVGVATLLVACSDEQSVSVRGTVTMMYDADLVLADPGKFAGETGSCRFGSTARMVITDESGDVIKTVELSEGEHAGVSCNFVFETSVPEADFYTFRIGEGDGADEDTFSRSEAEDGVDLFVI